MWSGTCWDSAGEQVQNQHQCVRGVALLEELPDGKRLSDPRGLLSAQSPRPSRSVLGPRVTEVVIVVLFTVCLYLFTSCFGFWDVLLCFRVFGAALLSTDKPSGTGCRKACWESFMFWYCFINVTFDLSSFCCNREHTIATVLEAGGLCGHHRVSAVWRLPDCTSTHLSVLKIAVCCHDNSTCLFSRSHGQSADGRDT